MVHARYGHQANWCVGFYANVKQQGWFFGWWLTVSLSAALEICNTRCVVCIFCCFILLLFFVLLLLLAIKLALGLFVIQALFLTPQTDWVLYGQASRAISTR